MIKSLFTNGNCSLRWDKIIEEKNNKLIFTAKTRRKSDINYVWIYKMYIFRFETQTFLELNTPYDSQIIYKNLKLKPMNLENKPA